MKRVLFVCLGNICRSPTAEGVMRRVLADRGLDGEIEVDSAGTGSWHVGEAADARMREAAERRGIPLGSTARQVEAGELADWDLVVAMDGRNRDDLLHLPGAEAAEIRLFSEFLPAGSPRDVPDPYFGGARGFDRVLDLVEEGCPAIVDELLDGSPGGSAHGVPGGA